MAEISQDEQVKPADAASDEWHEEKTPVRSSAIRSDMGDCVLHVGVTAARGRFVAVVVCNCSDDTAFEQRSEHQQLGEAVEALDELIPRVAARVHDAGHRIVSMALMTGW